MPLTEKGFIKFIKVMVMFWAGMFKLVLTNFVKVILREFPDPTTKVVVEESEVLALKVDEFMPIF